MNDKNPLQEEQAEFADNRLLHMLKKYLAQHYPNNPLLKRFRLCGSQLLEQVSPAVFVIKSGSKSRLFGLACCHNSWGCPRCTAKRMAEYGTAIGTAIDALKTKYHESAFMMTLTLPHKKWQKIEDVFTILKNSWRRFNYQVTPQSVTRHYTHTSDRKGKKGQTVEHVRISTSPFGQMRYQLDIKHLVRVYEFTWSRENGWHPHIHALLWTPDKNFNKLNDGWEEKLLDKWWQITREETLKLYNKKYPSQEEANQLIVEGLYHERNKHPKTGHKAVFFSRDRAGKVKRSASSEYISGWGGDNELANDKKEKRAALNHYSPRQLLETAYEQPELHDEFLELYVSYLKVTYGSRRVQFSLRSGLTQIIKAWRQTTQWKEVLKKKITDKAPEKWEVVCWFDKQQWLQISFQSLQNKHSLINQILKAATEKDPKQKIAELLEQYDIKLHEYRHPAEWIVESVIYENYAKQSA